MAIDPVSFAAGVKKGRTQGVSLESLSVTMNGTYRPVDADGYNEVEVEVPQEAVLDGLTVIENGTYAPQKEDPLAPYYCDGFNEVTVEVPQEADLIVLHATENGWYTPQKDDPYMSYYGDGFSEVNVEVDVPEPATLLSIRFDDNTPNGSILASGYGCDGFNEVILDITRGTYTIRGLSVDKNGTYRPEDYNCDGFGQVDINVCAGEQSTISVNSLDNVGTTLLAIAQALSMDLSDVLNAVNTNDLSIYIEIDASALGLGYARASVVPGADNSRLRFSVMQYDPTNTIYSGAEVAYALLDGSLLWAYTSQNGTITDMSPYASMLPTTLTLIKHPVSHT